MKLMRLHPYRTKLVSCAMEHRHQLPMEFAQAVFDLVPHDMRDNHIVLEVMSEYDGLWYVWFDTGKATFVRKHQGKLVDGDNRYSQPIDFV